MGRRLALKSLEAGARHLIIWDTDSKAMNRLNEEAAGCEGSVHLFTVDVSNSSQVSSVANKILDQWGPVDILFNNAAIVTGKPFRDQSPDEIEHAIGVNITGPLLVAKAFLPGMIDQASGHIVNIASAAGLMANPGMSVYAAGKWAVSGWSDSLRLELEQMPGKLRVTTVQPSFIDTGMFEGARAPLLTPYLQPDTITEKIMAAVESDRVFLREPFMVKLVPFLKGILPRPMFDFVAGKIFRVYESMKTFKGDQQDE